MTSTDCTSPSCELDTRYGVLTIEFRDPTADAGKSRDKRAVAYVSGELTINRIPLKVQEYLAYVAVCYRDGKELAAPVDELRPVYEYGYTRRTDDHFGTISSAVREKLWALFDTEVRTVYESHKDLQLAAERVLLAQRVSARESERDKACAAYLASEQAYAQAVLTLAEWEASH